MHTFLEAAAIRLELTIDNAEDYFRSDPGPGHRRTSQAVQLGEFHFLLVVYRWLVKNVPYLAAFVGAFHDSEGRSFNAKYRLRIVNSGRKDFVRTSQVLTFLPTNQGGEVNEDYFGVNDLLKLKVTRMSYAVLVTTTIRRSSVNVDPT